VQRNLLSSNPGALVLIVVFCIGAIFFAIGSFIIRRERIERVEALLAIGDDASVRELTALRDRAASQRLRDAADDALLVIASRAR
jgi:hypothetical protein